MTRTTSTGGHTVMSDRLLTELRVLVRLEEVTDREFAFSLPFESNHVYRLAAATVPERIRVLAAVLLHADTPYLHARVDVTADPSERTFSGWEES